MITDLELAWTAGLFEGEGTVRINKPSIRNWGSLCVSVVNTDPQIVEWFQARWPAYMKAAHRPSKRHKPAMVWVAAAWKAVGFLQDVRPHIVRDAMRERIDHGIAFQHGKINRGGRWLSDAARYDYAQDQWNAYWWMCHLNRRGADVDA